VFAILLIVAFFLPWLDWGLLKKTGWDIPGFQQGMTKTTNFIKFFSKNKESEYTAYVVFSIPFLSVIVCLLWIWLKQKAARFFLLITGILGIAISINLFYKLPKAGSGVYLLCVVSVLSVIYCILMLRKRKKKEEIIDVDKSEYIDAEI
jgi:O-antigen/teichoic acid export membrane protein